MNDTWKTELTQAVTDVAELCRMLELPVDIADQAAAADYPLLVPRCFIDRMEKGNPNDPLLRQILPCQAETATVAGFSRDPLNEFSESSAVASSAPSRVLKKYAGRALLIVSDACGVHCRFCFRRFFPKSNVGNDFETMLEPIRSDETVTEVILSGGDPLWLDDSELNRLLHYIIKIPHVKRLRIHSRLPIVLPSRLTPELIGIFSQTLPIYLVLHVNHPNELSGEFWERHEMLLKTPNPPVILSQTVLLKGINDDAETLFRLFERLIDHRIIPYYLHQLDRVQGSAHFEVPPAAGLRLMNQLRRRLPGYAVPNYVREVPGAGSKLIVNSE